MIIEPHACSDPYTCAHPLIFVPPKCFPHVFAPVRDALEKSGLIAEDLDAVLFIGGSSENPIVREAVMKGLGCDVEAIIPSDLRSHVSKGGEGTGKRSASTDLKRL